MEADIEMAFENLEIEFVSPDKRIKRSYVVQEHKLFVEADFMVTFAKSGCKLCGGAGRYRINGKVCMCKCANNQFYNRMPPIAKGLVKEVHVVGQVGFPDK